MKLIAALFAVHVQLVAAADANWPAMAPLDVVIGIDAQAPRIEISLPLRDVAGVVRYTFRCRGGAQSYIDGVSAATDVNYVGPLMCMLNEGTAETEGSLLAEDDAPPWHTRGQFAWSQLLGSCGEYPEYGRVRHFQMRGFQLVLEAKEPTTQRRRLEYFNLSISVRPDPSANTRTARQTGYLPPRAGCTEVRRGDAQRMCRNAVGSYEPCSD